MGRSDLIKWGLETDVALPSAPALDLGGGSPKRRWLAVGSRPKGVHCDGPPPRPSPTV
jgi:hypothetical protein